MKSIKNFIFLTFLGFIILFSSCDRHVLIDKSMAINGVWPKDKPGIFKVEVTDTSKLYNFYLNIRHNNDYRFSNLYVFLQTDFPNKNISRDTLEIILANKEGKWLGKGWGNIKEDIILLKKNLRFPLKGNYKFVLWQGMRKDTLKGIEDIGIRIQQIK